MRASMHTQETAQRCCPGCVQPPVWCLWQGWQPGWLQVVKVALDLAGGLAAIHAAGILHRDLKASNVLMGALPPPPHSHRA
jgi:hypothetical protein